MREQKSYILGVLSLKNRFIYLSLPYFGIIHSFCTKNLGEKMKKTLFSLILLGSLAFAQDAKLLTPQELSGATLASDGHKQTLREKMLEKELKLQVPRETVPVEAINYPIKSSIPKTAEYLPMLQTLLHIEAGTLPNPIGVSIIGSFMEENYNITKFNGTMGANIGNKIAFGLQGAIRQDKDKVINAINNSNLTTQQKILARAFVNLFVNSNATAQGIANFINNTLGAGEQKEWQLSEGTVHTRTGAVGVKLDTWIFPFMQLFATGTYLNMQQSTNVGDATIPLKQPLGNISSITFPVGILENKLDGWAVMGGTNLAIGYKGFFLSCMIAGGYVKLDDLVNNVKGFVKKPFMYVAPRVGYSLGGVFTAHFGVQRVELFGSTGGNDLSKITGGLVDNFSVEIEKFPVNFLIGTNFTPMRDFGISFEYVFSPDVKGLNAELAYRF